MSNCVYNLEDFRDLDGFGSYSISLIEPPGIVLPPNPFDVKKHFESEIRFDVERTRLPPRERPPPMPKLDLTPSSVEFLEQIPNGLGEDAPSGVFRVHILDAGERLLKIFRGVENGLRDRNFAREAIAYENLLHAGLCDAGVVPQCYGWTEILQEEWRFARRRDWLLQFREDKLPLQALILEFIPHASKMTLRLITPQRAERAMKGLEMIHAACVVHNDIHPRNILVLPDDRIVWVDFENAASWPRHGARSINTWLLENELIRMWERLFLYMLPWKWSALKRMSGDAALQYSEELDTIETYLISKGATILNT